VRDQIRAVTFAAAMGTAMAAWGGVASAQSVTLHLGHVQQADHPMQIASERFADLVAEATDGDIEVISYPAEQLANLRGGAEGVQLGTVDIFWVDSGTLGNWAPEYSFVSLPFMFADFASAIEAMDGLEDELIAAMRDDLNVERLAWAPAGFRVILSNGRPVNEAADLDGLKIRVPEIPIYVNTFAALNANATPLPWGDVYTALQTGVVEGVEGPPAAIRTAGFAEVADYMARTNHIMTDLNILMNLDRFNSLSDSQQAAIREAAHEAFELWFREEIQTSENEAYEELTGLMEANNDPDMESFREAMAPVWDDFIAEAGPRAAEWIERAQAN